MLLFGARLASSGAGDEHLWEYDAASDETAGSSTKSTWRWTRSGECTSCSSRAGLRLPVTRRFFSEPLIDAARLVTEDKLSVVYPEKSSANIWVLDYTLK